MLHSTWLQTHRGINESLASDINEMVKERGKVCVSVIVPTHRLGQDRQSDLKEIQKAISTAKHQLPNLKGEYLLSIDDLFQEIDFKKNKEGIGIFISPNVNKLVKFPFPVAKKVVVDKYFYLHDLLYVDNYRLIYYVLDLSKKEIHLFRGKMDNLEEIDDDQFPIKITDDYEYSKPSASSSAAGYTHLKSVEKDKTELQHIRLKKIFQTVDKLLANYIEQGIPIILCGAERDISLYKSSTKHLNQVVTSMSNNYSSTDLHDLEVLAWLEIKSFIDKQKQNLIDELNERVGEGLAETGITNVWQAANEGRGLQLLVEKDFTEEAFVTTDNKLHLSPPSETYTRYTDIVSEIIAIVLEKNGKVVVIDQDALRKYERIALLNRY